MVAEDKQTTLTDVTNTQAPHLKLLVCKKKGANTAQLRIPSNHHTVPELHAS
jgi:hypothetical protein